MACTRSSSTGSPIADTSFSNWAGDVQIKPSNIFQPNSIDELVAIVLQAERAGLSVHAVGSGWSFNDNFSTPGYSSGTGSEPGYLVRTDALNRILSNSMGATTADNPVDPSPGDPVFQAFTGAAKNRSLVNVEAGIQVHLLCETLDAMSVGPRHPGYGYAVPTLGGSGGQSIAGAISTSTHGGDVNLPPLPDMVQGIHLVAAGGAEFFIQRGGAKAIVDTQRLAQTMPCVAGRIISDDDVFNSVLVSMGRMGIIYSMVLEVVDQFVLAEHRYTDSWQKISANVSPSPDATTGTIGALLAGSYFLQVVILPYANSTGDHDCYVSTRARQPHDAQTNPDPNKNDPFSLACRLQPLQKSEVVLGIIATADSIAAAAVAAAATVAWIPFVGEAAAAAATALTAAAVAVSAALAPLLVPSITLGDYIAAVTNLMTQFGLLDVAKQTVNALLGSQQAPHDIADKSYKVMDTYDYQANCYKSRSLEVAFDAGQTQYLHYIADMFRMIDDFAAKNILYGGYISLRYCGKSEAKLAIEQWPHTVCLEMAALAGLDSEMQVLNAFEAAAAADGAAIHWGQLNNRTSPDIESIFSGSIAKWREVLVRLSAHGSIATFDNDYCVQRGLEPYGATYKKNADLSYIVPLLLG